MIKKSTTTLLAVGAGAVALWWFLLKNKANGNGGSALSAIGSPMLSQGQKRGLRLRQTSISKLQGETVTASWGVENFGNLSAKAYLKLAYLSGPVFGTGYTGVNLTVNPGFLKTLVTSWPISLTQVPGTYSYSVEAWEDPDGAADTMFDSQTVTITIVEPDPSSALSAIGSPNLSNRKRFGLRARR